jgi:hypothetical protein
MSTNGTFGFVIDGEKKIAYNHSDSYPGGLGLDIRDWLIRSLATRPEVLPHQARALRVVDMDDEPTGEDITRLAQYYNPNVGGRSDRPTWYQLLRRTQGDPDAILNAGVVEDGSAYVGIEYAYLVDFDERVFIARDPYDGSLGGTWSFDALPSVEEFLATFEDAAA